jgi:uncharacterized membrane protein
MTLMILGLALWSASHLFKRLAPGARAALGETPGKIVVTIVSIVAIVLMVKGFRGADFIEIWSPPAFLTHVNNLLMLVAVFLLNLGYSNGVLRTRIRHPMLTAVKTWAFAHLLVNGDLASIVLFGGLMAWAVVDLILINRQEPAWVPPAPGPVRNDLIYAVAALLVFGVIAFIHNWLGHWPFG